MLFGDNSSSISHCVYEYTRSRVRGRAHCELDVDDSVRAQSLDSAPHTSLSVILYP